MKPFTLSYTVEAAKRIRHLHPALKQEIRMALDSLTEEPWSGKSLKRELMGLLSLRVKAYRIIYHIDEKKGRIVILTLGKRKTIYEEIV